MELTLKEMAESVMLIINRNTTSSAIVHLTRPTASRLYGRDGAVKLGELRNGGGSGSSPNCE
jgi:hypothetical protein